jgi:hypothetical protein
VCLFEDKLLDGRNRWRACEAAGIELPADKVRQFDPAVDGDPLAWVISKNLKRRHLAESQRAMVAANIATLSDGQRQVGKFADVPTQENAAKMLNVGERSVRNAVVVRDKAEPELKHAVEQGHLAVSVVAAAAKLPAEAAAMTEASPVIAKSATAVRRHACLTSMSAVDHAALIFIVRR